jgi:hypothetical protein
MNKSVDELLALLKNNLEPADFLPQFGFHESNLKYIFCWALEKVGLKSYGTEVSLPVYPQAPQLSGPKGKRKSIIDLVVNINGYLIGFEFKTDSLRIIDDDKIAYINNLSCVLFTCLETWYGNFFAYGSEKMGRSKEFWQYEFETFASSGNFGLLTYEPTEGCLSTLRKPTNVKILPQYLPNLSSSEEDILKFKVWKIFRKDGYKVVSEPKPKHAEVGEEIRIAAPPRRKHIVIFPRKVPKIKRIDLIAVKDGRKIGIEVKAHLWNLGGIREQLSRYLNLYDLDILYLAVPIHFSVKAKDLILSYADMQSKLKVLGI